ncbi:MAG: bifunctional YncE family protein/alkaline phosphatase family protein [Puia sp.]|nr:bifunctional YncE family protein/alkaline phosphatase family protein [Puia sp.]
MNRIARIARNQTRLLFACLGIALVCMSVYAVRDMNIFSNRKVGPQPDGSVLVPSNQLLRPAGFQVNLPGRPLGLVLTPDESRLVIMNSGSLDLLRVSDRTILQTLPYVHEASSFTGICMSADGRRIFTAGSRDRIFIAEIGPDTAGMRWDAPILLPKPSIGGDPVPGGLALDPSGNKIYITLSRSNTLAVIDLRDTAGKIQVPVGIAPYDVVLASSKKAYVSNWGGRRPLPGESSYNSSGSQMLVDPRTGVAGSGTLSVIDLDKNTEVKSIEVGLHPSGMALSPARDRLYVACANSDRIFVVDTKTDRVIDSISVHAASDIPFGSAPNALTVSPDGKYLYVANGTENAICVIRTGTAAKVLGYMPTGWYPGAVILDKAGKTLFAANLKGIGSRNKPAERRGYNSHDNMGTISIIPVPDKNGLAAMTQTVHENNSYAQMLKKLYPPAAAREQVAVPQRPNQTSFFKHVLYIIKENRTYDQVFGDLPQGDGDTSLVQFGRDVTPNQHRMAETFVLMDNFNCSGILSADGHQWTDEAYVTDYLEKSFADFSRSYPYDGDDAMAYSPTGFIWDNVLKHGLTVRDYGEFVKTVVEPKTARFTDILDDLQNGSDKIKIRAEANIDQLAPYICPGFPGFTNRIPDVYRSAEFIKELKGYEKSGELPNFMIMELPNNHTTGTTPKMPTPKAAVADNDLALGQIVEAVSHSRFWKETCIFVTEDDPQAGLDHVDGHRTVGLVISPYTKRGKVVTTYYSQINMVRTIEDILGIPPMNQLDWTADPMLDCFTDQPDTTPYTVLKNNIPLDQLNLTLDKLKGSQLYWAKKSLEQDLDEEDRIEEDVFNRIIWHSVKGYDRPYPVLKRETRY